MTIAADTQDTDRSNTITRCYKIEQLTDGRYFLGSGHNRTIALAKQWAETSEQPDFGDLLDDLDEYGFDCLVWGPQGVMRINDELGPYWLRDEYFAIGSGSAYAIGALDAGASAEEAVKIACRRDMNTSEPIDVVTVKFD